MIVHVALNIPHNGARSPTNVSISSLISHFIYTLSRARSNLTCFIRTHSEDRAFPRGHHRIVGWTAGHSRDFHDTHFSMGYVLKNNLQITLFRLRFQE